MKTILDGFRFKYLCYVDGKVLSLFSNRSISSNQLKSKSKNLKISENLQE